MPERAPFLFAAATRGTREKNGPRGRNRVVGPTRARQAQLLEPKLARITAALDAQRIAIGADPQALEPDTILVLEIAGDVTNFARAMQRIRGLEFLGEQALDQLDPDDDFRAVNQRGDPVRYQRQLFLMASDVQAWRELLTLWQSFRRGETLPYGLTPFRDLFAQIRDLRGWDDRDRLERAGAATAWVEDFRGLGNQLVPFEAELWLRRDLQRRAAAVSRLREELVAAGGAVDREFVLEQIDYHGVLGRAPAWRLLEAAESRDVSWLSTDGVRLFHAVGQMAGPVVDEGERAAQPQRRGQVPDFRTPTRLALLDGVPVAAHEALEGRVLVDDPDDWEPAVAVTARNHGTLMASLVVHGDLGGNGQSLTAPIYVRPILMPDPRAWFANPPEMMPVGELPVDLIHRAVARLFEGRDPAAPNTKVVVLATGDPAQQFDRLVSPLARLLDWLSWRYTVLFVVSSGNHMADLVIPNDIDITSPSEVEHEILSAVQREALSRRLLAPGESTNAVTVGAAHDDSWGGQIPEGLLDPMVDTDLPNIVSPLASGINRSVKPDVLLPGGRQLARLAPVADGGHRRVSVAVSRRPPGLRVAAPGLDGDLNRYVHTTGTSGATGIAGNACGFLLEQIDRIRAEYGDEFSDEGLDPVLVKAALVHTARWGSAAESVREALRESGRRGSRPEVALVLGNGRARPELALVADDNRVVLLRAGRLAVDESHTYTLPLPPSLAGVVAERRLLLTLAWFAPTLPRHRAYRAAALDLRYLTGRNEVFGDRQEVDNTAAGRGTLLHEVLMTKRAVPFADGEGMRLRVECRSTTGTLDDEIPYALIATIDTPAALQLPIYQELRQALAVRPSIAVRTQA